MLSRNLEQEDSSPKRNGYKIRAFARAIEVIAALEEPVQDVAQVKKLKGVGVGISNRIDAFLSGKDYTPGAAIQPSEGSFETFETSVKARKATDTEKQRKMIIQSLTSVSGIGTTTARILVDAGCTSTADLKIPKYLDMLTTPQQIGARYYEHFERPVERSQAEQLAKFISGNISCKFEVQLVGNYRRGAQSFSDVDILLTHPSHVHVPTPPLFKNGLVTQGSSRTPFRIPYTKLQEAQDSLLLHDVVFPLQSRGLIVETLSAGTRKWDGVIRLPERTVDGIWEDRSRRFEQIHEQQGLYIRLHLNLAPVKSKGAALLALTGDKQFNIDIRNKAVRLGVFLDEFGLWRWTSDASIREDADEASNSKGYWSFVEGESEIAVLASSNHDASTARRRGRPRKNVA